MQLRYRKAFTTSGVLIIGFALVAVVSMWLGRDFGQACFGFSMAITAIMMANNLTDDMR